MGGGRKRNTRWGEGVPFLIPSRLLHTRSLSHYIPTPTSSNSTFDTFELHLSIILLDGMQCIPTNFIDTQYRTYTSTQCPGVFFPPLEACWAARLR